VPGQPEETQPVQVHLRGDQLEGMVFDNQNAEFIILHRWGSRKLQVAIGCCQLFNSPVAQIASVGLSRILS